MKFNKKEKYFWKTNFNINKESEIPEKMDYISGIDSDHDDMYFFYLTARVKTINEIYLRCTFVTDEGVFHISKLSSLKKLSLINHNKITAKSLEYISKLQELEYLDISKNEISIDDLNILSTLKNLKELHVPFNEPEPEIVAKLYQFHSKLPLCIIYANYEKLNFSSIHDSN